MENYIRVYDDVVSDVFCDKMIIQFEKTPKSHFTVEHINREGRPTFHQINFHNLKEWQPFSKTLQIVFKKYIHIYEKECNITEYHWPIQYGYEQYRMKKYLPNDKDEFKNHVDVQDHASARRFLALFLYLDNNEAGQTTFDDMGITVDCIKGRLLMFPPIWNYLHAGLKPVKKSKYIVGSYLHYL